MFTGWHGIRSTNGNVGWKRMCHKVAVWALPPQFFERAQDINQRTTNDQVSPRLYRWLDSVCSSRSCGRIRAAHLWLVRLVNSAEKLDIINRDALPRYTYLLYRQRFRPLCEVMPRHPSRGRGATRGSKSLMSKTGRSQSCLVPLSVIGRPPKRCHRRDEQKAAMCWRMRARTVIHRANRGATRFESRLHGLLKRIISKQYQQYMKQQAVTNSQGNDVSAVNRSNEEKNQEVCANKAFEAQKEGHIASETARCFSQTRWLVPSCN